MASFSLDPLAVLSFADLDWPRDCGSHLLPMTSVIGGSCTIRHSIVMLN